MTPTTTEGRQTSSASIPAEVAGEHGSTMLLSSGNGSLDDILANTERREILDALQRAGGQRASAARLLRISRSRLYRRMGALGIETYTDGPPKSV